MLSYSPSSFIEIQLANCISLSDVTYIDHVTIITIDLVKIHHPCFPTFTCHPEKTVVLSSSELSKGYNSVVCNCTRLSEYWGSRMLLWANHQVRLPGFQSFSQSFVTVLKYLKLSESQVLHMQHWNNNCTSLLGVTVRIKWISTHKGLGKLTDRYTVSAQWV